MNSINTLERLGWHPFFEAYFYPFREQGYSVGRVGIQHRERSVLYTEHGELWGEVSGKFRHEASGLRDYPAVGDWVVMSARPREGSATIHEVLERRSKFSRKAAGEKTEEQIVAANVDSVFLVMGLDEDFNLRRLERYLTVAWESGASPVIVLNKMDLCADIAAMREQVELLANGATILMMSAKQGDGVQQLLNSLAPGKTGALLGSSGVGKSTIVNLLVGSERQETREVRETDHQGRHTTVRRELILLPTGGWVIDTPGMRELQLWGGSQGLHESFKDVEELAARCRFRDCKHEEEPDCAVRQALEDGVLDASRYRSYQKLLREIHYLEMRQDHKAAFIEKQRWKKLMRYSKEIQKRKGKM